MQIKRILVDSLSDTAKSSYIHNMEALHVDLFRSSL